MSFDHPLWLRRIALAESEQSKFHPRWERSRKLYDMSYWTERGFNAEISDAITPVNYATTFVSTLVAATFARNPKMFIRARRARFEKFAAKMDEVVEQMDDEQDIKEVYLEVLIDAIICNVGWVECGWIPPDSSFPTPETADQVEHRGLLSTLKNLLQGQPPEDRPQDPIVTEGIVHEQQEAGQFYVIRRSPYDVLWPPGFHRYTDLPYLIIHERLMAEDFLRNPRYRHKEQAFGGRPPITQPLGRTGKLVGPSLPETPSMTRNMSDQEVVHLYTIWDRRHQEVTVMSKGSLTPHDGPYAWPYFSEGFNVIPLQFNIVPDTPQDASIYGFSDIEPITPQVIEKSNIRTDMVDHRRRSSFVVFVQRGSQTEDDLEKYQASMPMQIVPVTNIQSLHLSPEISLPPALFETESAINSDLDRDSGLQLILSDTKRAASFERATVATIAQGNANLKTAYKVDRLEAFFKHVAHYRIGLYWQYMTKLQVGELLGEIPDEEEWMPLPSDPLVARQRVRRELELKIQPGSTRPIQDDVLDREQFLRATSIFQASAPDLFDKVKRDWISALAKKFRDPVLENLIKQATDSEEEEHAQQENQLLMQGAPQVVQGDDQSHLTVHAAFARQDQIKAHLDAAAAHGITHPLNAHLLGHAQRLDARQARKQGRNQKSQKQRASSPSGSEVSRMGTPSFMDVVGQSQNLRAGTGPVNVGSL